MADLQSTVKLSVDGYAEREVMKVDYTFTQATDIEGQIAGIPRGGRIVVKVKAQNDGNVDLLSWMLAPHLAKSGKVEFQKSTDGSTMKAIEFEDAYCVDYAENWTEAEVNPKGEVVKTPLHSETITLSCRQITLGAAEYSLPWK